MENWNRVSRILSDRRISLRVKGKSIQDGCKTSNDVRCRDIGSEESTIAEVGGSGGSEVVNIGEWGHQAIHN